MESEYGYRVMEHFYTLQGEGFWSGTPAYFVRLGGCDVGCFWCDVKESWDKNAFQSFSADTISNWISQTPARRVVITGGEPLLHNLDALCKELTAHNLKIHVETSGTQPVSGRFDWVTFSPKKFKAALPEWYKLSDELKVIVHNRHDLQWAETHRLQLQREIPCFLQPEWYTPESANWIIDYVRAHPHWRLSLQTHKYLQIP